MGYILPKGISRQTSNGSYQVRTHHNGEVVYVGTYKDLEEAKAAYAKARANLNKLPGNFKAKMSGLPMGVTATHGRFQARSTLKGVMHHLGTFNTPEEAEAAIRAFKFKSQ